MDLPKIAASSEYIDFRPYPDASVLCISDVLSREDRFIEEVASFLEIDAPSERINFVWAPYQDLNGAKSWACSTARACYRHYNDGSENFGLITSNHYLHYHELVHAVEVPELGNEGRFLGEGLAEYLSSNMSTASVVPDFYEGFYEMLNGQSYGYYPVAMHFVGSIIQEYGIENYKILRKNFPRDETPTAFAHLFESVYGIPLDDALIKMSEKPIRGRKPTDGCTDDSINKINWTEEPILIDAQIEGKCGDGWFASGSFTEQRFIFNKEFSVEIIEAGYYDIKITGDAHPFQPYGVLRSCKDGASIGSGEGVTGSGVLQSGQHILSVYFPQSDTPMGVAHLRLEYISK